MVFWSLKPALRAFLGGESPGEGFGYRAETAPLEVVIYLCGASRIPSASVGSMPATRHFVEELAPLTPLSVSDIL